MCKHCILIDPFYLYIYSCLYEFEVIPKRLQSVAAICDVLVEFQTPMAVVFHF